MNDSWKFTFFIARRLQKQHLDPASNTGRDKKVARPITRIATVSIALAMIVNIITIAVVDGFQQEVRHKVIGFGSHISIQKLGDESLFESEPIRTNPEFESMLRSVKGISSVQKTAYKPALLQSVSKTEQREILGVIFKGIGDDYQTDFLKSHLVEGHIPKYGKEISDELVLSRRVCNDLHYHLGDTIKAYFVKNQPLLRQFRITGIYETGLEDFDKKIVFAHLPVVQILNDWGIQANIVVEDTLIQGDLILRAEVSGGSANLRYDWGDGYETYSGIPLCPDKDTVIRLIVSDFWININEEAGNARSSVGETVVPDTAYVQITVKGDRHSPCNFKLDENGSLIRHYDPGSNGFSYTLNAGSKTVHIKMIPGKGSFGNYIGGYELMTTDWNNLDAMKYKLSKLVLFTGKGDSDVQVKTIRDTENELFVWLGFLDINMGIILILMLLIGIINMGAALLVMILVRTNFIGVMKSYGAGNKLIRRVFIVLGGKLIIRGMIWGNIIGLGMCVLQSQFGILQLDPKVYYLTEVPVALDLFKIGMLNIITVFICISALTIPSIVISRISPSKAIRFR